MPESASRDASLDGGGARPYEVELLGRRFVVRSDDDPRYVAELVAHVDRRLREIQAASGAVDSEKIALLCALDLADRLSQMEREHRRWKREVAERGQQMLDAIDALAERLDAPETVPSSRGRPVVRSLK